MDDLSRIERMYGSVNEYYRCMEESEYKDDYEEEYENMKGYDIGEVTACCHCDDLNCNEYRIYGPEPMYYTFICPHEKCIHDGREYGHYIDNKEDNE